MKKILIDTDVLGDVDDSVALAYVALNPFFDIQGITTVHGHPEVRANFAKKMMIALGKGHIPVAPGEKYSMSSDKIWIYSHEERGVEGMIGEHEAYPLYGKAAKLLYNKIIENKNGISLLCIGSLTNIAKLVQEKPEVKDWINDIYFMGGAVEKNDNYVPDPDVHNVKVDPKAAEIVFSTGIPLKIVTREDSKKVIFMPDDFEGIRKLNHAWAQYVYVNAKHYMKSASKSQCYMYDPLTAIAMARPELIRFERRGHIYKSAGVDAEKVKNHLLDILGGKHV
jgi:inosine-uridine nucleoside N-ribohydrolase